MLTKDQEIILSGYKKEPKILKPSADLLSFQNDIENMGRNEKTMPISRMNLEDALGDTQYFFNKYFRLHKVLHAKKIVCIKSKEIYHFKKVSPFSLPIYLEKKDDDIFYGALIKRINHKANYRFSFKGICLNSNITELTSCSYCHEITHSQLDSMLGSIRHFYNTEILSVFIELLHAYVLDNDERILFIEESRRLNELIILIDNIKRFHSCQSTESRDDLLEDCKYIASDLKALQLFSYFYYASEEEQLTILNYIQKIFDGELCLEEFLNIYNINYKDPDYSHILKYLKR